VLFRDEVEAAAIVQRDHWTVDSDAPFSVDNPFHSRIESDDATIQQVPSASH